MMVSPGLEFCQLLMGSKQGGGRKDLFVVGLDVCTGDSSGASSTAGSKDLRGALTSLGNCSLCAGKGTCLSLSCRNPGIFIFSPFSPLAILWRYLSPDTCSHSACSPVRQGDSLCKCLLVCSVCCCSVLLSPGTAARLIFRQLCAPQLLVLVCTAGSMQRAVPRAASQGMRGFFH